MDVSSTSVNSTQQHNQFGNVVKAGDLKGLHRDITIFVICLVIVLLLGVFVYRRSRPELSSVSKTHTTKVERNKSVLNHANPLQVSHDLESGSHNYYNPSIPHSRPWRVSTSKPWRSAQMRAFPSTVEEVWPVLNSTSLVV